MIIGGDTFCSNSGSVLLSSFTPFSVDALRGTGAGLAVVEDTIAERVLLVAEMLGRGPGLLGPTADFGVVTAALPEVVDGVGDITDFRMVLVLLLLSTEDTDGRGA